MGDDSLSTVYILKLSLRGCRPDFLCRGEGLGVTLRAQEAKTLRVDSRSCPSCPTGFRFGCERQLAIIILADHVIRRVPVCTPESWTPATSPGMF